MAEQEVAEQEEWTHDTMIEGLWRTPEKKEISILYERQDKSRYSGQAPEDSREWKDFFHKFTLEQVDQFSETNRLQREIQNKDRGVRVQRGKKEEKQKVERRKAADDLETLLTENRVLRQRSVDIGVITSNEAIEYGCSGPVLRAAGVPWDLRRSNPYDTYV